MRRRAAEFRRPTRRRFSTWIWMLVGFFLIAGLLLFISHHRHLDQLRHSIEESHPLQEGVSTNALNFTEELLSSTSFSWQLLDQMTLAKAYLVIAKERGNLQLAWELSAQIRNCQRLLSQAAVGGKPISVVEAQSIINSLSSLIYKAQDSHYDIATTIVTLKNHIQAVEERLGAAIIESAQFGQLVSESVPKSLHCLNTKLTVDWITNPGLSKADTENRNSTCFTDNNLYHFCVFSDNVLAASVVVNSTITNAEHPQQLVFHIVTDAVNFQAMRVWFLTNNFRGSAIEVQNIEDLSWLNASYSPLIRQLQNVQTQSYYFRSAGSLVDEARLRDPKFISLLNHLRFYIPQVLPKLEKVVFLDDDVVVQKDLTTLFSLDLNRKVNGAVETCLDTFHRYYKYLNFSNPLISSKFDPQACGWAFGMNIFDLIAWKKFDVTSRYHYWQEQNADHLLWKAGTLPAGLLAFYGLTEPLDQRWHVTGLGYDVEIDDRLIESGAVLHFDGVMKPWLKLAVTRYRPLWEQYVNHSHPYLRECFSNS